MWRERREERDGERADEHRPGRRQPRRDHAGEGGRAVGREELRRQCAQFRPVGRHYTRGSQPERQGLHIYRESRHLENSGLYRYLYVSGSGGGWNLDPNRASVRASQWRGRASRHDQHRRDAGCRRQRHRQYRYNGNGGLRHCPGWAAHPAGREKEYPVCGPRCQWRPSARAAERRVLPGGERRGQAAHHQRPDRGRSIRTGPGDGDGGWQSKRPRQYHGHLPGHRARNRPVGTVTSAQDIYAISSREAVRPAAGVRSAAP